MSVSAAKGLAVQDPLGGIGREGMVHECVCCAGSGPAACPLSHSNAPSLALAANPLRSLTCTVHGCSVCSSMGSSCSTARANSCCTTPWQGMPALARLEWDEKSRGGVG